MRSTATTWRRRRSGSTCPAAAVIWPRYRPVDWQGRHGLRGFRRRRLLSRTPDLRAVDHRREAEPADQGARVEGLVYAHERLLAAQARPRHERHRTRLRLQGKGVPGPVEQGVPPVAARHERARRRGSSHAGLSHAAHLQRGRQLRRHRHVGRAGDVGGGERHALDSRAVLGPEALAVHRADRIRRRRAAARSRPSRWKTRPARSVKLTPAWLSRDMDQAEPPVVANGVVFAYGSGENTAQADVDRALDSTRRRTGSRSRRTRPSTRSTRAPARSSGRAAIRSLRSITSAGCRSPTAGSTSARMTACCTALASRARAPSTSAR